MGVWSNKIERENLKPGDHIYSWRHAYIYAHHGIYVGEGKVIHFTRSPGQEIGKGTVLDRIIVSSAPCYKSYHSMDIPCSSCGDQSKRNGVITSCIDCFLSGGNLYLFEYGVTRLFFLAKVRGGTCTRAPSDPPEDVIHRAKYLLENGFGSYDVFKNNCEDFAIYCKTGLLVFSGIGVGGSGQASSFGAAAKAGISYSLRYVTTSVSGLTVVGFGLYCAARLDSEIGGRRDVQRVPVEILAAPSGSNESESERVPVEILVARSGSNESEAVTEMFRGG